MVNITLNGFVNEFKKFQRDLVLVSLIPLAIIIFLRNGIDGTTLLVGLLSSLALYIIAVSIASTGIKVTWKNYIWYTFLNGIIAFVLSLVFSSMNIVNYLLAILISVSSVVITLSIVYKTNIRNGIIIGIISYVVLSLVDFIMKRFIDISYMSMIG